MAIFPFIHHDFNNNENTNDFNIEQYIDNPQVPEKLKNFIIKNRNNIDSLCENIKNIYDVLLIKSNSNNTLKFTRNLLEFLREKSINHQDLNRIIKNNINKIIDSEKYPEEIINKDLINFYREYFNEEDFNEILICSITNCIEKIGINSSLNIIISELYSFVDINYLNRNPYYLNKNTLDISKIIYCLYSIFQDKNQNKQLIKNFLLDHNIWKLFTEQKFKTHYLEQTLFNYFSKCNCFKDNSGKINYNNNIKEFLNELKSTDNKSTDNQLIEKNSNNSINNGNTIESSNINSSSESGILKKSMTYIASGIILVLGIYTAYYFTNNSSNNN